MSEFQNRAVELQAVRFGAEALSDKREHRNRFLSDVLGLFHAMGGTIEDVRLETLAVFSLPAGSVVGGVGEMMNTLAGISHAHDFDMMQAAYNILDENCRTFGIEPGERLYEPASASQAE